MSREFTHLHVHTQYSLLDGASKPAELLAYAKSQGMDSIAITDHGSMYGVINFYQEAKKQGIKPIIGCECYITPGSRFDRNDDPRYHLILLAENNEGYQNLSRLVSTGFIDGFYRKPRIDKDILRKYSKGIIALSACVQGEIPRMILQRNMAGARRALDEYVEIFGKDNFFLEMQNHGLPEEALVNRELRILSRETGVKLVVTNDLHYVKKEDAKAQDVLLCIQTNKTVDDPNRMRFNSDDYYCKNYEEMLALFPDDEEALHNTHDIAERCNVDFTFGKLLLPQFPIPEEFGGDADAYVRSLCLEEIPLRYGRDLAACKDEAARKELEDAISQRLDYELGIIKTMGYSCYFLIVWDFIHYCRSHKDAAGNPDPIPVGPGRGSAAGSIVAYLLHITNIDPLKYDLLFERFLNPERVSMPDIDTDFCYKRRGEVMEYVIRKYGAERVALIITFGTLQARAAVRDVGRALDVSLPKTDKVAKAVPRELGITLEKALGNKDLKAMYDEDPEVKRMIDIARSVEGLPRNSGTHAAGVVIAPCPLIDLVPLQLDEAVKDEGISQDRMITTQYDKDKVEELGLLKMDFLGLRTLTVLDDAVKFIRQTTGETVDLDNIPLDDPETSAMLCRGDTQGVFQLESGGMTRLVVDLAPTGFRDLIPLVALYRPGPLGTGMADDFIQGRHGHKTAESLHPLLDPVLADTYGVVLYQEQVMKIASVLAGFSLGEADILRRAMGKKKAKVLDSMQVRFVEGAKKLHNIPEEQSAKIFALLQHFAGYGFNKSHSVAYALVAYQTAYLKAHWPAEFFAALITSVISDPDKMSWYLTVCRERGIDILPPDVNASLSDFSVEKGAIRFGLNGIKSVGGGAVEEIIKARKKGGPFTSILDFCKRVDYHCLNRRMLENLIRCGAMDSTGGKRSQLLAVVENALDLGRTHQKDHESGQIGLFGEETFAEINEIRLPELPEMNQALMLKNEKELIGFYVTGHPLDGYKKALESFTPLYLLTEENSSVKDNSFLKVGGIISRCEVKSTKRGDTMAILTLEDFSGKMSVIAFPKTYSEYSGLIAEDSIVGIEGRFSVDEREAKVIASEIVGLEEGKAAPSMGRKQVFKRQYRTRESAADYESLAPSMPAGQGGQYGPGDSYGAGTSGQYGGNAGPGGNSSGVRNTSPGVNSMPGGNGGPGARNGQNGGAAPSAAAAAQDAGLPMEVPPGAVIYLRISGDRETPAVTQSLMKLFTGYSGDHLVFLDLMGSRKRIRVEPRFFIDAGNPELQRKLVALLGPGSVHVKTVL